MKVLLISTTDMNVIQINGVTNIAFASGNVTITAGSATTYSLESYKIQIIW